MDVTLTGCHLIGDMLMQTPALRAFTSQHPEARLRYVYGPEGPGWQVLPGNPHLAELLPRSAWAGEDAHLLVEMDVGVAAGWAVAHGRTLCEGFGHRLGVEVTDLRYDYRMTPEEAGRGRELAAALGEGRPVIVCARHSASCSSNDADPWKRQRSKCLVNDLWVIAAREWIRQGFVPVAVGSPADAADRRYAEWPGPALYGEPLRAVAGFLRASACVVAVDTGIRHLAAAVGANLYCVSTACPLEFIRCVETAPEQRIVEEFVPIWGVTPRTLLAGVRALNVPALA